MNRGNLVVAVGVVGGLLYGAFVGRAWAGETFMGRIYVSDAGTVSNATTGYGSAGCASQTSPTGAGACDQAFPLGSNLKLTIQCDSACGVSVNRGTTDAGIAMALSAAEKFPTSLATTNFTTALPDAGSYTGGLVSISPTPGSAACRCNVFIRSGTE